MLRPYIDPSWDLGYQYDPTNNPYLWFAIPYLDTDNDEKVSVGDLYDGRFVSGNGVLEKSEAIPENLFGPKFVRNIIAEIFKLTDRNKDESLSMDDAPLFDGGRKLNETGELCYLLRLSFAHRWECKNQMSTYLPLFDV